MKVLAILFAVGFAIAVEAHYHGHNHGWDSGWGSGSGWGSSGGWDAKPSSTSPPPKPTTQPPPPPTNSSVSVETKTLAQLYNDAKAEGCHLIVYAGGDTAGQQDWIKDGFQQRFPDCKIEFIVDYSKYHDARMDIQMAENKLVPDVVQLQTLQDFPRWKKDNRFLNYKVRGWDQIYEPFKDPEGAYLGIYVTVFTNCYNKKLMPNNATWPREIHDYLRPELKGHITLTYINDDDAVLFLFKKIVDKYGFDIIKQLMKQNITWVRGTQEPADALEQSRTWVSPSVACDMNSNNMNNPKDATLIFALPEKDPFQTWPQTAGIFKTAKNPASAKLYLNWLLDPETQKNYWPMWSTRKDVLPPGGYKSVWDYPNQTNPTEFLKFMSDREGVERFKFEITQIIGEAQGPPSPGWPGLYPVTALPH